MNTQIMKGIRLSMKTILALCSFVPLLFMFLFLELIVLIFSWTNLKQFQAHCYGLFYSNVNLVLFVIIPIIIVSLMLFMSIILIVSIYSSKNL